jgi:hypothetical protein
MIIGGRIGGRHGIVVPLDVASDAPINSVAVPTITSITPPHGAPGATRPVLGTAFLSGATATVGSAVAAFSVTDATHGTLTVPALAPGSYQVAITNPGGLASNGYAFTVDAAAANITSYAPNHGPAGTRVDLYSSDATFVNGASAKMAGFDADVVTFIDPGHVWFLVPYDAPFGSAPITIDNGYNAPTSNAVAFTFEASPAVISSIISTTTGAVVTHAPRGTVVQLLSADATFLSGATATVGGVDAGYLTVLASSTANLTIPAGAPAGSAPIIVQNPSGAAASAPFPFTVDVPSATITSATPTHATRSSSIALVGTSFVAGATATVGGVAAALAVVDATHATLTVPALASYGSGPIVVTNPGGAPASNSLAFAVDAPAATLSSATPARGIQGDVIALVGTSFVAGATATVGGVAAALAVVDATHATLTVPAVDGTSTTIQVTNPYNAAPSNTLAFLGVLLPTSIDTPSLWLAPSSRPSSVTLNSGNVAAIADQGPNGWDHAMGTAAQQLGYAVNAATGRNCLRGQSTGFRFLLRATPDRLGITGITLWAAFTHNPSLGAANRAILAGQYNAYHWHLGSADGVHLFFRLGDQSRSPVPISAGISSAAAINDGAVHTCAARWDAATAVMELWLDGSLAASAATTGMTAIGDLANGDRGGCGGTGTSAANPYMPWPGDIFDCGAYPKRMSDIQLTKTNNFARYAANI